ncbi:cytoskeleton-associated protein 2-like isoform X2 [Phycodurus eques]|uniref:cytoskeleton-associated protein 2-like isoform X2 n=1 Tax=Phycodurus eques TaxID=693459 RepID=UPI002ACEF7C3|nr:cytoskeleton-associated protein 2-like isoform X2 [Phycodurus eques]
MDEEHPTAVKSRKELRKERIMGYLTNKGKLNSKPNIVCLGKKSETAQLSALQLIKGKENKAPVTTFHYEAKNVKPLAPVNNQKPPRKTFVIANKENVRTERQSEQSTLCKKSFTGTYTVNTLKATSLPKKPPNVRIQLTGKASSTFSVAKNSNNTFRPPSNPATSYLAKNYTARLSLGPIVKTRTGLIPAMIQPRVARPLPAADAGIVFSRVTVPSSKAMVKKIPLHQRPAVPRELKSLPGKQPSCKSGLKSTVTASTSARLPDNVPRLPDNVPKLPAKHTSQPKGRPMIQKSAIAGRTSKKPGMVSGKPMAAKPKMTDAAPKRMSAPVAKQTASRTTVTVVTQPRLLTKATKPQAVGKKMAAEQEERMKKLQAWREAKGISYKRPPMQVKPLVRRAAAAPQPLRTTLKVEDDACAFIRDAERSLSDCIKLLAEGCPAAQVREVLSRLPPVSQKFAKFWICKARLMEQEGDLDILPIFEEAVRVVLEPVDELRTVVFDILKKKDETQAREGDETEADRTPSNDEEAENCEEEDPMETPPVRVLISGEMGPSSNVKYKITATPGAPSSQQRKPIHVDGHEVRFFTPVRRSVRIESASRRYPVPLREHDQCVASFAELLDTEEEEEAKARGDTMYVYRENEALEDKVVVRLVRKQDTQS